MGYWSEPGQADGSVEEKKELEDSYMDSCEAGVIVIGGHVQGLGLIRSLAKRGIPVYLIDNTQLCIARFSRHCKKFFHFPKTNQEKEFVEYLLALAETERINKWLLIPTTDGVVATLSKNRTQLEEYFLVPVPEWDTIQYAYNKKLTYELASKLDVPIPKTLYPNNKQDVAGWSAELTFPVIIKPTVMHVFYKKTGHKVIVARSREELLSKYVKACQIVTPPELMIQEIIPGSAEGLYSFCSFFKQGEVIANCMGRRARQIPMDFGKASTFVESVNIPELEALSVKILRAMDYYGLSEVEFKWDPRDEGFKLLEVNPRSWKWHTLALRSGINLPYLLYADMHGDMMEKRIRKAQEGVKWVDFYTDTYVAIKEILRGNIKLRQYVSSLRGQKEFAVASWDDPLPFVSETLLIPYLWRMRY